MPYLSKDKLEKLLVAGQRMSNICYNLSQSSGLLEQHRTSMKDSQIDWDSISSGLWPNWKGKRNDKTLG